MSCSSTSPRKGATLRGILSCLAISVSKGLQYGVPLEEFVDTFTFQTFEPRGMVEGHPNIKMANSIIDYVFRALGVEYLHRDELAQVPPVRGELPEPPEGIARRGRLPDGPGGRRQGGRHRGPGEGGRSSPTPTSRKAPEPR